MTSRFAHRGACPGPLGRSWSTSAFLVAMLALVDVPDAFAEPFLTCQQVAAGVTGADVAVYGDVDGDGRMDLLAIDMYGGYSIFKQTTARNFGGSVELMDAGTVGTTRAICPTVGPLDLDKDGYPDSIFLGKAASWRNGGSSDLVYFGGSATSGSGTTTSMTLSGNENRFSNRCAVGDLNGDGALDIAIVNIYFGQKDVVFLNQGARGFGPALDLSTSGFGHDIKIADIDQDGIADVIVSQSDSAGEYVLYGVGDGTFTNAYRFNSGSTGAVEVCDLNGDGYPDVITGDFYSSRGIKLYMNKGSSATGRSSQFQSAIVLSTSYQRVYGIACGDIDGDGDNDLVIAQTETNAAAIYFENIFTSGGSFSQASMSGPAGTAIASLTNANQISLFDVDGDGNLDLIGGGKVCFNSNPASNPASCDASGAITNGAPGSGCTSTLAHGTSCSPTCDSGYTLSGTRSCSAGTLTDNAMCSGDSCDASNAITNGALNNCTSTLASGATCTPTCNTGYTLSGTRSCTAGALADTAVCNINSPAGPSPFADGDATVELPVANWCGYGTVYLPEPRNELFMVGGYKCTGVDVPDPAGTRSSPLNLQR